MKNAPKATVSEAHILEFINHVCDGDLAKANNSLNSAIKEKMKDRIRSQQVKETK